MKNYPKYPINSKSGKCDRCGGNFPGINGQESIECFLLDEYPNKQICINCDRDIQTAQIAAIQGTSVKEFCKKVLKNYGVNYEN